jgi:hypothetical protein
MSYIINNSRGNIVAVIPDGTTNTSSTSLSLVGQGVTNYGTAENENWVYLLENFAAASAPLQPILGQLWYNSTTDTLNSYSTGNVWIGLASTAYVDAQKVSPEFIGIPTAPTAANGTSTSQIATTAFVQNQLSGSGGINTTGPISTTGNITGGNIVAQGSISAIGRPIGLPKLTSSQRNLLTPSNGDLIYNTTENYVQCYQANAWVNMTQARYN